MCQRRGHVLALPAIPPALRRSDACVISLYLIFYSKRYKELPLYLEREGAANVRGSHSRGVGRRGAVRTRGRGWVLVGGRGRLGGAAGRRGRRGRAVGRRRGRGGGAGRPGRGRRPGPGGLAQHGLIDAMAPGPGLAAVPAGACDPAVLAGLSDDQVLGLAAA